MTSPMRLFVLSLVVGLLATEASAHGAVTFPPPRNAIDADMAPWNGSVPNLPLPFEFMCPSPSAEAVGTNPHNLTLRQGQACFWFNNGCDLSCDECDGSTGAQSINLYPKFISDVNLTGSWWTGKGVMPDPNADLPAPHAICKNGTSRNATICDPKHRTVNTNTECGSSLDFYYYAPWRAPGRAPVIDACGMAGGRFPGQGHGIEGADYHSTPNAPLGMRGSALPRRPSGTVWKAGDSVEVAWTVKASHGGGYQYRLCPANSTLTEDCFQERPLDFVGQQSFRWGGMGGKQMWFNGTYVTEGTTPTGSMWSKIPVPRGPWDWDDCIGGMSFEPACEESAECANAYEGKLDGTMTCKCSGRDLPGLEIVDRVRIPADLPAGEWVLGWRWDCEQSSQIWSSCSDVTITRPDDLQI
jgi:hypothetical protein